MFKNQNQTRKSSFVCLFVIVFVVSIKSFTVASERFKAAILEDWQGNQVLAQRLFLKVASKVENP